MKYLLYYNSDNKFVTDQRAAGGDGTKVVSVVDGVAWTNNNEKVFYRTNSNSILTQPVTVNYIYKDGQSIAPSETISVDYYNGMTTKVVITPKNVDGFVPLWEKASLTVPTETSVDFVYGKDFEADYGKPLTFEIISGGTLLWLTNNSGSSTSFNREIRYRKNNDATWTSCRSSSAGTEINVSDGDILEFVGDNSSYHLNSNNKNYFGCSENVRFNLKGNILSLLDSQHFKTFAPWSGGSYIFAELFRDCKGVVDASELLFPNFVITNCYTGMFSGCTNLIYAPDKLPALTYGVAGGCYDSMFEGCVNLIVGPEMPSKVSVTAANGIADRLFKGCENLKFIKCLLTMNYGQYWSDWVKGVSSTGIFVMNPNSMKYYGDSGIPQGWTIYYDND